MATQNACAAAGSAALRICGLLESVPDAIIIADAGGRIVRVNAQTRRLFGYAEDIHTLQVHVANLRRKIEPDAARTRYIHTEPRVGYRFDAGGSGLS